MISISRIIKLLQQRTLSIPELESAAADRIYTYNPLIRAMLTINDESRMNSYDLNQLMNDNPEEAMKKKLLGVPTIVKDVFLTDDQSTSGGSIKYYGYRSKVSAPIIDLVEEEGVLIMGKASTPEMAADVQTYNEIVGICRNPWNLYLTAGGSSGGVAAAISMGFGHFGLGSDLAGSLRIPANFTGTVSLRPTEGRISTLGHLPPIYAERLLLEEMERSDIDRPLDLLFVSGYGKSTGEITRVNKPGYFDCLTVGPMGRSVVDIEILANVLFTPCTEYGFYLPRPKQSSLKNHYEIAISSDFNYLPTDKRVKEGIQQLGTDLDNWNMDVSKFELPYSLFKEMRKGYAWFGNRYIAMNEALLNVHDNQLENQRLKRENLVNQLEKMLEPFDFWILPVAPTLPYPHNLKHDPIYINGASVKYWKATISYTSFLSYSGFPILTIPIKIIEGLPLGIQIVGKRWQDEKLLAFGKHLENLRGLFPDPPLYDHVPDDQEDEFLEEIDPNLFDL